MTRGQWVLFAALMGVEVAVSVVLAGVNPLYGYDECWYRLNSYAYAGVTGLPFAPHRPPVLPLVLSLAGGAGWLIPAVAHIVATALIFLVLRRVTSAGWALGGMAVFMACGLLRVYNVFLLTEMPVVCLWLGAIYLFILDRPVGVGAVSGLLVMTHFGTAATVPLFLVCYGWRRQWPRAGAFVFGAGIATAPFLMAFALSYGDPLAPILFNLHVQRQGEHDWAYYLRTFPQLPVGLMAGAIVAALWAWRNRETIGTVRGAELIVLLLGLVVLRLVLLHAVVPKGSRFLVPLIPMLIVMTVVTLYAYRERWPRLAPAACGLLVVSVLPGRSFVYLLHDLSGRPEGRIEALIGAIEGTGPQEPIYTDVNDLSVMAQTGRRAVAVVDPGSWHHKLRNRPSCGREAIPSGAYYLTRSPAGRPVIASVTDITAPLYLVRWRPSGLTVAAGTAAVMPATGRSSQ